MKPKGRLVIVVILFILIALGVSVFMIMLLNNRNIVGNNLNQNNNNSGVSKDEDSNSNTASFPIQSSSDLTYEDRVFRAQTKTIVLENLNNPDGKVDAYVLYSKRFNSDLKVEGYTLEIFNVENGGSLLGKVDLPANNTAVPVSFSYSPKGEYAVISFMQVGTGCPSGYSETQCALFTKELDDSYQVQGGIWSYNLSTKSFTQVASTKDFKNLDRATFTWNDFDEIKLIIDGQENLAKVR